MTTKTRNTIDDIGKWMGRASMAITCFFVTQLYYDFRATAVQTTSNSTRLDVHDVKIQALNNITEAHARRLDNIQRYNQAP